MRSGFVFLCSVSLNIFLIFSWYRFATDLSSSIQSQSVHGRKAIRAQNEGAHDRSSAGGSRIALVLSVCSGIDWKKESGEVQLQRAERWVKVYRRLRAFSAERQQDQQDLQPQVDIVLLVSGYTETQISPFRKIFDRIVEVDKAELRFRIRKESDGLMPIAKELQKREDGQCTSLKLWAWSLTVYDAIFMSDVDLCLYADPLPYIVRFLSTKREMLALPERHKRGYWGLKSGYIFFRPSKNIWKLLVEKARFGDFVGYTNGEQDVVETVYSAHSSWAFSPRILDQWRFFEEEFEKEAGFEHPGFVDWANPEIPFEHDANFTYAASMERNNGFAKVWDFLRKKYALPPMVHFKQKCCTVPGGRVLDWAKGGGTDKEVRVGEGGREVERICYD